ncbi:MAG TPA: segregation/condensation protein A [Acidobacteriota bacterium]|nr:segregation/condensation protein A [Acidobacteriota bacterium]
METPKPVAPAQPLDLEATLLKENSEYDYKIKLATFEGPLDLLLYLIKRDEVDIYDIPIARIAKEYLTYIQALQELDIDLAGEFLVMAATLIHIKSQMLLPKAPASTIEAGDEPEDPRSELVRRLLEHQKYKTAAHMLWSRAEVEQAVFTRPIPEDELDSEVVATVFDLLETFRRVVERRREKVEIEIARDEVTQAQKLIELRSLLSKQKAINVRSLFEASRSKREMICILLALLELVKEYSLLIVQEKTFGDILVRRQSAR